MNTEKIEKLKKGLTNSQIPESLREKIRQQISRLEAEDKANEPAPKEEAMPKKEVTPKAPTVRKPTVRKPTVRKPRAKKVVEPKTSTSGKTTAMSLAKEIRKDGEKWTDAVKRAGMQMKKGTTEVKKSTKTEMQKLLALVKRRKELKGISGTNLKRDSQRKAKPRGARTVTNSGQTSNKFGTYDNKLGRKYTENRDNRTDRLAPKYPKNAPLLELGGTVVTDLAGNTSGGDLGLNAGMPLSGFSNTAYTGLVGETGAMSSGEMFANGGGVEEWKKAVTIKRDTRQEAEKGKKLLKEYWGKSGRNFKVEKRDNKYVITYEFYLTDKMELGGGLPSGSEQHYVNYYLGSGTAQGIFEHGGGMHDYKKMEDNYANGGFMDNVYAGGGKVHPLDITLLWRGYASAILFAEMDYDTDESLDNDYSIYDFDKKSEADAKKMLSMYYSKNEKAIKESGLDLETIGMDIWYTQGGHGAGFFDHSLNQDVEDKLTQGANEFGMPSIETNNGKVIIRGISFENGGFMDNVYAKGGGVGHYKVKDNVFIDYMDAVDYCDRNNLSYNEIVKTKNYAKGGGVRIKNGQTYDYGRVWTNDHNQFDKGADHEVNYRR